MSFDVSKAAPETLPSGVARQIGETGNSSVSEGIQATRIRLVLVDELGLFRASLARFLAETGFDVTGQSGTCAEALELLKSSSAEVVLVDFKVGGDEATDFISAARRAGYQGFFLIVAGALDVQKSALALKVGASGIFLKSEPPERLMKAIEVVADGGVWVDPKVIQLLAEQLIDRYPGFGELQSGKPGCQLDDRERNVLLGVLGGLSNRKIGDNLGISESSVKNVMQRLFSKSGVKTRSQLVRVALEGSLGAAGVHKPSADEAPATADMKTVKTGERVGPLETISQSKE